MIKIFLLTGLFLFFYSSLFSQEIKWTGPSVDFSHGNLVVSSSGRYLEFGDDLTPDSVVILLRECL